MGEPVGFYWRHFESFADVWTGWYTDHEPESLLVATLDDRVVGYLAGCVDTKRAPSPEEAVKAASVRHLLFLRRGTAGFFVRALVDTIRAGHSAGSELDPARYPAHLHIDLLAEARGHGLGGALMRAWLARLATLGVPGCHLGTLHENEHAIGFFSRHGFRRLGGPEAIPGLRSPEGHAHHVQLMVRDVASA